MSLPKTKFHFCLLLIFTVIFLDSCKRSAYHFIEGLAQGTTYHITYQGPKDLQPEFDSILKAFDMSLSAWEPNSILSRINRNDTTAVADKLFTDVFMKACEVNKESEGLFDITVGPLVKAWGFYNKKAANHDSARIKQILNYIGMAKVHMVNYKVMKANDSIVLDVNAIAQGYAVDVVCGYLDKLGVKNYIVEIGGELRAKGKNPDGKQWRVGIDKPVDGDAIPGSNLQSVVLITNKAMATSGDYRRFIVENGRKYSHHLNPKTGYPSNSNLLSATIVADNCITADAFGTVCMVSGLEKSIMLLKKHKELQAYLIYSDDKGKNQVYITEGLMKSIQK